MASEMGCQPLRTVAQVRSGFAFKSGDMGAVGLPVIKIKNIVPPTVDTEDCERVPEEVIAGIPNVERFELKEGDILIAMTGATVGKVGRLPRVRERYFLNQRVGKVYLNDPAEADYRFLYYVLSQGDYVRQMFGLADGSAQANISGSQIESIEIPLPSLPQQQAISTVLGTLDDKIELNQRMSETFEAMARALFKSWFVDFDPVRAKMEGQDPGLPKEIADLFPSRLVESELGEIPEGWKVRSLDEIGHFLNGLALQKYPPVDELGLPVIKIAQLRAGNATGADRASADLDANYIVKDGDILFSWSGSLECVLWVGGEGALNQHLFKVTSATYPRWLCYLGIHTHLAGFRRIAASKATTMGHIRRHHLSEAKLAMPPDPLLQAMSDQLNPIVEVLWKRGVESRTLATLRDALLPKLISGEIRVQTAMRHVEEAIA